FFFSSRRRHTRFSRDWSSVVSSSDLPRALVPGAALVGGRSDHVTNSDIACDDGAQHLQSPAQVVLLAARSLDVRPVSSSDLYQRGNAGLSQQMDACNDEAARRGMERNLPRAFSIGK